MPEATAATVQRRMLHAAAVAVAAAAPPARAPLLSVVAGEYRACVRPPGHHPGVWPTTGDTYALRDLRCRSPDEECAPPAARAAAARAPAPLCDRPAARGCERDELLPGTLAMKPGSYTIGPDSTIEVHLVLGPDAGAMAIGTHVSVTLTVAAGSEQSVEVVVDVYSPRQPIDDVGSCALAASTRREDTWTHLVYMHADNDLESPMLDDVREMADAFKDDAGAVPLNLIVLLDRAHDDGRTKRTDGAYDPQIAYSKTDETPLGNIVTCDGTVYPGTPSGSMLLQLVAGGKWLLLERTPEKNMDDPSTLSSFIAKGIGNFKADKYMVNLNDHGARGPASAATTRT